MQKEEAEAEPAAAAPKADKVSGGPACHVDTEQGRQQIHGPLVAAPDHAIHDVAGAACGTLTALCSSAWQLLRMCPLPTSGNNSMHPCEPDHL